MSITPVSSRVRVGGGRLTPVAALPSLAAFSVNAPVQLRNQFNSFSSTFTLTKGQTLG